MTTVHYEVFCLWHYRYSAVVNHLTFQTATVDGLDDSIIRAIAAKQCDLVSNINGSVHYFNVEITKVTVTKEIV